jgi:hypothetical protein
MSASALSEVPTNEAVLAEIEDQIQFHHVTLEKLMIARSVILDTTRKLTKKAGKEAAATVLSIGAPADAGGGKPKGKKARNNKHRPEGGGRDKKATPRILAYLAEHPGLKSGDITEALAMNSSTVWNVLFNAKKKGLLTKDEAGRHYIATPPNGSHPPVAPADLSGGGQPGVH